MDIKENFSHMNNMQQKAVFCTEGPLLILAGQNSEKLFVPGNKEVEFTLVDNGDDTFTLSYTVKEEETEATTAEPTEPETPAPTEPETPAPTEAPTEAPTDDPNVSALISVGKAYGKAGQTVQVPISISDNPGITCMTLDVSYDSSALTLTGVTDGGILGEGTAIMHSDNLVSPYRLCWANDTARSNFADDGDIATLTFVIAQDAQLGSYGITVSYDEDEIYSTSGENVKFNVHNSSVEVIDFIYGDVDRNGKVNSRDRTALAQYLAHWVGFDDTSIDLRAADVDLNGKVNSKDRTTLAKHIAKWTGFSSLPKPIEKT